MTWFRLLRVRFCRYLCPDLLFNSDMSLEIDRLLERIRNLEEQNAPGDC